MTEKNKIYVGKTGHSCACCSSSYPTFIYIKNGEIKQEQILAENSNANNLIKKITMTTLIEKDNENHPNYKRMLEATQ